jgi:hypothetical protein
MKTAEFISPIRAPFQRSNERSIRNPVCKQCDPCRLPSCIMPWRETAVEGAGGAQRDPRIDNPDLRETGLNFLFFVPFQVKNLFCIATI